MIALDRLAARGTGWRTLAALSRWQHDIDAEQASTTAVDAWLRARAPELTTARLHTRLASLIARERKLEIERDLFANALLSIERCALAAAITNEVNNGTFL